MEEIYQKIESLRRTLSQNFHGSTKLYELVKETSLKNWPDTWKRVFYKGYPRLPQVLLSKVRVDGGASFEEVLSLRTSVRDFSKKQMTEQDLSRLLYYSAGIKKSSSGGAKRFYPSAGGRYPLEVYLAILNVDGVKQGVYHYYPKAHSLELLQNRPFRSELFRSFSQAWVRKASVLFIVTAVFFRTEVKYGDRGYRHVLVEAGYLSQNFYLVSTALGLGCCSIGGYIDDAINSLLDLDGVEESVVGVVAVGKPRV